jgi:two-component system nitrogen regulation response regulator GlnG/two-component system response regulator HydG
VTQDATLPPAALTADQVPGGASECSALVVLWSRDEPERIGEVLLIPHSVAPWIFGRGETSPGEHRLALVRQRPAANQLTGPLGSLRISRVQLCLTALGPDALEVDNAGRCPLTVDGREQTRATIRPGAVLELHNELLMLCTTRPATLPRIAEYPSHPFGQVDDHGLLGESPAVWALRGAIAAAAQRSAHVLVLGESGTGKELVAQALHARSDRAAKTLVARNATTIPEGLLDAELFGNLRNYPNPGTPERPGLIGQASGSTLLLDEFAELPPSLQAHLLRVLDGGEYQRLGEAVSRRSDFRLVAATNRPEGDLKHDLLARLKIRITVPGLGERREDIPLLAAHLLRRHATTDSQLSGRHFHDGFPHPRFSPALVSALVTHPYTTHVRELDALLLTALLESPGKYLELTPGVRRRLERSTEARPAAPAAPEASSPADTFTQEERGLLELQRKHRFRATDCGSDPGYPGNRQTADLHFRKLTCKALPATAWDVDRTAALLAGGDDDLRGKVRTRIETFLHNLARKLEESPSGDSLMSEWRGDPAVLRPVLDALLRGAIKGRGEPGR